MICAFLGSFQVDTASPVWQEVTLSLQAALHPQPQPKEEKRRGFVLHWEVLHSALGLLLIMCCIYNRFCCCLFWQRTRATQIIPCTVSQLMSASQSDESFKVGDVEVAQVSKGWTYRHKPVSGSDSDYQFVSFLYSVVGQAQTTKIWRHFFSLNCIVNVAVSISHFALSLS